MKVSEGIPRGRCAELYNPKTFSEGEEVIVFTRDEFNRTYTSMQEQINKINKIYMHIEEDWKLLGYWPQIMERIHILDLNMDLIFKPEPLQCYLDAYICDTILKSKKQSILSKKKASAQIQLPI